ncbi:hypothetical protein ACFWP2_34060 [Kitasatospora sp. NPDC058444]|uniref:hypothetical protein n=1 Tax=Kitasatospora sp. NPDC058444 TaxID=3346504 RepID=UPI0036692BFD
MPEIPDFPEELADQHHHWHDPSAHPGAGPGRTHPAGTPGGGLEFLTFHRNFVAQFHAWYDPHTFTTAPFDDPVQKVQLVAPWHSVPTELRKSEYGWDSFDGDAQRLDSGTPDFATADELGTFIELGIHNNFLHGAAAAEYNEPVLASFHSPHITQFYGIHGLVDYWWAQWQRRHKIRVKELLKEQSVEVDLKQLRDTAVIGDDLHKRIDDVKRSGLEKTAVSELSDGILDGIDPETLRSIGDRLTRLERQAFPGKAFVGAPLRPRVGEVSPLHGEADDHR